MGASWSDHPRPSSPSPRACIAATVIIVSVVWLVLVVGLVRGMMA